MREDVVRAVELLELAGAEDRDLVGHLHRFIDVMTDEHHRFLQPTVHLQELVLDHFTVDRIDRAERLVHQQHRRIGGECARHTDALLLSARELLRIALEKQRRIEVDRREQLAGALARFAEVPAQQFRHHTNVLFDRHVGEEPDLLDDVADRATQLDGIVPIRILTIDKDLAGRRFDQPVDHLERRRLAAA